MLRNEARTSSSRSAPTLRAFDEHAAERDVDRQLRERASRNREPSLIIDGPDFRESPVAVADRALGRCLDERELRDVAELQRKHAQDHAGERRAQDLRIGVALPLQIVVFAVKSIADAGTDAPAAALALIGGRLRYRLDVQSLELVALRVALDARGAGIDHVADARHGQRSLGDVRREHDASLRSGPEHAILFRR